MKNIPEIFWVYAGFALIILAVLGGFALIGWAGS